MYSDPFGSGSEHFFSDPDPNPAKRFGSFRIRIRLQIRNTGCTGPGRNINMLIKRQCLHKNSTNHDHGSPIQVRIEQAYVLPPFHLVTHYLYEFYFKVNTRNCVSDSLSEMIDQYHSRQPPSVSFDITGIFHPQNLTCLWKY